MLKLLKKKFVEEKISKNIVYNFYLGNEWKLTSSTWCAVFNVAL